MNSTQYPLTWDLESLMPDPGSTDFRQLMQRLLKDLQETAAASAELPRLEPSQSGLATWSSFLDQFAQIETLGGDLRSFVACHAAADAENKDLQRLEAELSALTPLREQAATNLEFALRDASDAELKRFVDADPKLAAIAFFLQEKRRQAEVRLPKEQEMLAAELDVDGIHAWGRLYDRISGALRVQVMERGEIVEKSIGQIQFDSPQRAVRENNFYAANRAWDTIAESCADAVNHIAGSRLTRYRRLGIDHLEVPCRLNRMRRSTLKAMWDAINDRKACLLDYMRVKAQALGIERLAWYDVSAPFPVTGGVANTQIGYDDACDLIIRTFGEFSEDLGSFARRAIEGRWIEAENRAGKRQGGFCTDFPGPQQTRIFMTYTDTAESMSTLAHELGHAYHADVLKDQPVLLQQYPMNLAETASTFAETILGERRLQDADSSADQILILDNMLADAMAFLMNIQARFLFEDHFHRQRAEGEVSAARLSEMMLQAQKEAYLDGLADDGWNPSFWISKLHFYISGWPFYNFPYTFGYLLSLGVCALGKDSGPDFPQQYRRLLIATGCQSAEDAVQSTFGDDLTKPAFWHKSLDVVQQRVDRFVKLAERAAG